MTSPTDEELVAAARSAVAWLGRWALHVGNCRGGGLCQCGLTAILNDLEIALADRLEALASRPDGWRGIASAPKDGTRFLGCCPQFSDEPVRVWRWRVFNEPWAHLTGWSVMYGGGYASAPTPWMPLPPAPQPDE